MKAERHTFRELNIADWFSLYRIIAAPVLILCIVFNEREFFSWFLLSGFISDGIDGFLARRLHLESPRGARLDSLGDIIILVLTVAGLFSFEWNFFANHAPELIILVLLYVMEIILSYIRFGKTSSFHTYLDKAALFMQAVFVFTLLFAGYYSWLFYITFTAGVLATTEEIFILLSLEKYRDNIKGIYWLHSR
jgi:phosphatidylglycerophosphate synthase